VAPKRKPCPKHEGHNLPKRKNRVRVDDVLGDGWRTPNTYCHKFDVLGDFSAVYALVVYDEEYNYKIAYIGMSTRIARRFFNHHALDVIQKSGAHYVQTWFKRVPKDQLRDQERELIRKYDPPLNLIGKVVSL
jgi:hypothetical protein